MKLKILIGINTLTQVEQSIYANHLQFFYRLGRKYGDKIDFIINTPRRQSIDRMRNVSAKIAVEHNCDYLMFIDDDVHIPTDTLDKLLEADRDIIAGWTIIRGYPFDNMFFKYKDGDTTKLIPYNEPFNLEDFEEGNKGLLKVAAVGFSCVLIKVSLLKEIETPYFVTGPYNTEDIYFCMKAKSIKGKDFSCYVHTGVLTSHILGPECIDPLNKEEYRNYYEKMNPELVIQDTKPQDSSYMADKPGEYNYEQVLDEELFKNQICVVTNITKLLGDGTF